VYINSNLHNTLEYEWALLAVLKLSNGTSLCWYENYEDDIDYFLVKAWYINQLLIGYLCMFSIECKPIHVN
jgi:hypothetical protein